MFLCAEDGFMWRVWGFGECKGASVGAVRGLYGALIGVGSDR